MSASAIVNTDSGGPLSLAIRAGFSLQQLVAEYRALRASVLKLWAAAHVPGPGTLEDITRFNEAIDQAVAESAAFFAVETERWRNIFLGVLGHELRGPLNSILLTSRLISQVKEDSTQVGELAGRLSRGGERMTGLLDDLLDYSRVSLGLGIPILPASIDLAVLCAEEIELQRVAWPAAVIRLEIDGPTSGIWDASRLKQVLGNLLTNAAKYGDPGERITVLAKGGEGEVSFSVVNSGPTIPEAVVQSLFEPLRRVAHGDAETERTSLGLGLFIVRQIVRAHGGAVSLSSADGKTVFKVFGGHHRLAALQVREGGAAERSQPNSRFALMPLSIAMAATETPGSRLRATSSRLNSLLCERRRCSALTTCLSMMCITELMHTIAGALDQAIVLTGPVAGNRALRPRLLCGGRADLQIFNGYRWPRIGRKREWRWSYAGHDAPRIGQSLTQLAIRRNPH